MYHQAKLFLIKIQGKNRKRRALKVLADNEQEAIKASCLKPQEITKSIKVITGINRWLELSTIKDPTEQEVAQKFDKIARLLKVKVPLDKAFMLQLPGIKNLKTRYLFLKVIEAFNLGEGLASAFKNRGNLFSEAFISLLESAEKSNDIEKVFSRIGSSCEKNLKVLRKLKTQMIYPAIVMVASIAIFIGFGFFLIPQLKETYDSFDAELPMLTNLVYLGANTLKAYPILWVIPLFSIACLVKARKKVLQSRPFQRLLYKVPKFGKFLWERDLALMLENLSILMSSGVPIKEGLSLTKRVVKSYRLKNVLDQITELVDGGSSLSYAFANVSELIGDFGDELANVVEIGEETGDLEKLISGYVAGLEEHIAYQVENFQKIIGPMMTIVLAGIGSLLMITVLYPLASLTTVLMEGAGI